MAKRKVDIIIIIEGNAITGATQYTRPTRHHHHHSHRFTTSSGHIVQLTHRSIIIYIMLLCV